MLRQDWRQTLSVLCGYSDVSGVQHCQFGSTIVAHAQYWRRDHLNRAAVRAAFQGWDQHSLHLACTLTKRLTELDGLVKHGCLPWERLMLLPTARSVNRIDLPLPPPKAQWQPLAQRRTTLFADRIPLCKPAL